MTSATKGAGDNLDGLGQDRDYQNAMAHMQRGEWPEAIRELEQLVAQNPGSASLAATLEEARIRARFDANTKVKPKRFAYPWQRMLLRATLVLVILIGLMAGQRLCRARSRADDQCLAPGGGTGNLA